MAGPRAGNYAWRKPSSTGRMCWLLLWGLLQAWPTRGSVLLARRLPQPLTSPGYPEPYPRGQESSTHIAAPRGFAVRLVFQDFDLEPSPDCGGDSVTVSRVAGSGVLSQLCGQQGSPLNSPPGQREFTSSGRSLQLTFRARASSQDQPTHLHRGFLAVYQAVAPSCEPLSEAGGGSAATSTPGATPSEIQSSCREPYYQEVSAGALCCPVQGIWKDRQDRQEGPHCVPVCGRPVTPMAQQPETLGSSRAPPGSFPWQALTVGRGRGGGALLGDRWVLTAAHTLYPKDSASLRKNPQVDVFLGHTHVDELLRQGSYPVRRVAVHPDYRQHEPHNFDGDIALLELEHRVALGPQLLPVCLPDTETLYRSGRWGHVSGFGVDLGWMSSELKWSRLPVAPREACEAWLRDRQRAELFSHNMFCVGEELQASGVCQGDSGSVYVVWDGRARRWVATGIVSWGVGCGKGYGFYTKVLNYVGWIKGVMGGKG
ncbi:complement C1r subcomponent-like protein isoform X2 [Heterocephalus glaber]|uniref:Complement C1r subcomponent-like protein isoform X2 n=1 Tax=Heterocephalus glaber TaxID=10181 RepID=A0AAX6QPS0_HETGA|nr:complement C1r subcomponent-like protein isoform X2 [Heterocephalus glaber]